MSKKPSFQNEKDNNQNSHRKVTNLDLREIQSPLIACLLRGFIKEIGYERTMEVASAAIQSDASTVGTTLAEKYGNNSIESLLRIVREVWADAGALEFSVLEKTEKNLDFNVTRCLYVEMYEKLGIKEFGFCLSCNRDASLINGFNPLMKLNRSKTIMQGAEFCDFRITIE
jgi:hypothetical protein